MSVKENDFVFFKGLGTTYRVLSQSLDGSSGIVEHTLEPKWLGAPMHKHNLEDEISYVLEGSLSVVQNGVEQTAGPGQFIVKPRGIWHTFWNTGDERVRFLEFITPGNFENYYAEIAPLLPAGKPPDVEKLTAVRLRYQLEVDMGAVAGIVEKYGLKT